MLYNVKKIYFLAIFLLATALCSAQQSDFQTVKGADDTHVFIETNYGKIVLKLYDDTPLHRDNFIKLVEEHVYDGTLFHRVIEKFMIQGGDPESRDAKPGQILGKGSLGYHIPAEFDTEHFHKRGALCAAREGDAFNPKRESSSSQFYIVQGTVFDDKTLDDIQERYGKKFTPEQRKVYTTVGGAPHLDGEYTVFGEVVEGMEVVDKIAGVKRDRNDRPIEDIRILSMEVVK